MMNTNVVIIEDEKTASDYLKQVLISEDKDINVIATLTSVSESIDWFSKNSLPDLIFLDIHLSDDLSFKIFEKCEITCPIIFTTAFDKYAIQAFELNSIGYLLKPISNENVRKTLRKFRENLFNNNSASYNSIISTIIAETEKKTYRKSFLMQIKDKLVPIDIADIAYFNTQNKVSKAYTSDGSAYNIDFNIEEISQMIDPKIFFRVNRQIIVNKQFIKDVVIWFNGKLLIYLKIATVERIEVSKARVQEFKQWLSY